LESKALALGIQKKIFIDEDIGSRFFSYPKPKGGSGFPARVFAILP